MSKKSAAVYLLPILIASFVSCSDEPEDKELFSEWTVKANDAQNIEEGSIKLDLRNGRFEESFSVFTNNQTLTLMPTDPEGSKEKSTENKLKPGESSDQPALVGGKVLAFENSTKGKGTMRLQEGDLVSKMTYTNIRGVLTVCQPLLFNTLCLQFE